MKPFSSSLPLWCKLDGYQKKAVSFGLHAKTVGYFFEQGTGKTFIAGGLLEQIIASDVLNPPQTRALFIVQMSNIDTTWVAFFAKHLPGVQVCRSLGEWKSADPNRPRVLLLHYEALPKIIKKLAKVLQFHLIVVDESHRLKDRATLSSRTIAKLRNAAIYKAVLSGTPVEYQPQDLWGQFRFLRPELFGTKWKDFEAEYFVPMPEFDFKKYPRGSLRWQRMLIAFQIAKRKRGFDFDKLDQFIEVIRPFALRVEKEDVLDLPPLSLIDCPVTLRGEQRRMYDELKRHMVVERGHARVTAPLKVTQLGKLQQICGGYVIDDDEVPHEVGRTKMRKVKALIRSQQRPIVIFCKYLQEVYAIERELRGEYKVATLTGRVKKEDRPPIINDFQNGAYDVLICQVKTGGVGIDLYRSCVAIVYSATYSFIDFDQLISRLHRRGQTRPVKVFLLYAENTVDEVIYSVLTRKRKVIGHIFVNLKGEMTWQRKRPKRRRSTSTALRTSQRISASSRRQCVCRSARTTSRRQRAPMSTAGTASRTTRKS